MTTRRENLLRVLRGEMPKCIPIAGHVDPYNRPSPVGMDPQLAAALGEVAWGDQSTVTYSRWLGLDIMDWCSLPVRITRRQVTVETATDGEETRRIWRTPAGELREVIRTCRDPSGAVSSNWTEHRVKGPDDLAALAAIFEDEVIDADPEGLERLRRRRELIGDDGLIMGAMAGTPLGMMYRVYSGVATLAYLWADARQALGDLFAVMEANYLRQMAVAAQAELDVLVAVDDTSTTTISPAMFEACNMDLTDRRTALAHDQGRFYFHHSCGLIRDLLPLYRRTRMDAVHAFTAPPLGNVTVAEGRRLLGDRITIITGIGRLAAIADRREARRAIHARIREAAPWDRFILGATAYPDITMDQMRFLVDCCREVGPGAT